MYMYMYVWYVIIIPVIARLLFTCACNYKCNTVYSLNVSLVGPPLDGIHAAMGGQRSTEQPRPRVDGDSNLPKEVGDQSSDYELHPWNRYMYMYVPFCAVSAQL